MMHYLLSLQPSNEAKATGQADCQVAAAYWAADSRRLVAESRLMVAAPAARVSRLAVGPAAVFLHHPTSSAVAVGRFTARMDKAGMLWWVEQGWPFIQIACKILSQQ
jgi:hypothetical protein